MRAINRFDLIHDEAYVTAVCVDAWVPLEALILLNRLPWPDRVEITRLSAEVASLAPYPLEIIYNDRHRN